MMEKSGEGMSEEENRTFMDKIQKTIKEIQELAREQNP